jgi:hypothetical protein
VALPTTGRRSISKALGCAVLTVAVALATFGCGSDTQNTAARAQAAPSTTEASPSDSLLPSATESPTPTAAPAAAIPTTQTVPAPVNTTTNKRACHPAYPDFCVPPPPPDLDCTSAGISGHTNFKVLPPDPHYLDADHDGIGCEQSTPNKAPPTSPKKPACDPAYPDFCIPPPPPDLDCTSPGIKEHKNFTVLSADPHRFDADHDGIGCEK